MSLRPRSGTLSIGGGMDRLNPTVGSAVSPNNSSAAEETSKGFAKHLPHEEAKSAEDQLVREENAALTDYLNRWINARQIPALDATGESQPEALQDEHHRSICGSRDRLLRAQICKLEALKGTQHDIAGTLEHAQDSGRTRVGCGSFARAQC